MFLLYILICTNVQPKTGNGRSHVVASVTPLLSTGSQWEMKVKTLI